MGAPFHPRSQARTLAWTWAAKASWISTKVEAAELEPRALQETGNDDGGSHQETLAGIDRAVLRRAEEGERLQPLGAGAIFAHQEDG